MISKFAMISITYRGSHGMESQNQRMCWTGRDPQGPSSPIHMETPTITPHACRPNIPQNQLQQEVSDPGGATFWDVPTQWDVLPYVNPYGLQSCFHTSKTPGSPLLKIHSKLGAAPISPTAGHGSWQGTLPQHGLQIMHTNCLQQRFSSPKKTPKISQRLMRCAVCFMWLCDICWFIY